MSLTSIINVLTYIYYKCFYVFARSLLRNFDKFTQQLLGISETWLNDINEDYVRDCAIIIRRGDEKLEGGGALHKIAAKIGGLKVKSLI